jgi:hypothetical protein
MTIKNRLKKIDYTLANFIDVLKANPRKTVKRYTMEQLTNTHKNNTITRLKYFWLFFLISKFSPIELNKVYNELVTVIATDPDTGLVLFKGSPDEYKIYRKNRLLNRGQQK